MTNIDFRHIKFIPASINEYPIIQNMGRFYVYDMSQYLGFEEGWEIPEDGIFECIDFKKYWKDQTAFPFLIRYNQELAGFAIIDKKGSENTVDFNMAQFFILKKFQNKGFGKFVAHHLFNLFKGNWEVMVIPGNEGAYKFWQKTISAFSDNFKVYTREVKHFNNSLKNIFNFDNKN